MLALAALLAAAPVVSAGPQALSVTIYRNPARGRTQAMDRRWLGGFALVTETRTVRVPRGRATIRFEGVAGGIIPASAIVEGLPGGTIEKNRDARLLSPAALVDGTLGRQVTLRRTDRASGRVREEPAELVAGPGAGVVLRTAAGIETLGCSGLAEGIKYPRVPADLSAKPTLSVETESPRAGTVRVKLSYLAERFDWGASYVATIRPDGRTLDLFGWLTLANANREGFARADVQAVAGRLSRRAVARFVPAAERLELKCYPLGTTSDIPARLEDIVVTARRRVSFDLAEAPMPAMAMAPPPAPPPPPPPPEDLGDLKLYRVPEPVSIAPDAQKQVALLARSGVPFDRVYRVRVYPRQAATARSAQVVLRMKNEAHAGLGLALPAGSTALYAKRADEPVLLGLGTLGDTAEGEKVEVSAGISRQVLVAQSVEGPAMAVTLTNANPFAVAAEVAIGWPGAPDLLDASAAVGRIDGVPTWVVTVPAGGTAALQYRVK